MIELRWVKRVTARYPSGSPMCTECVLQYRINTGPRFVKEADGSMGVRDGIWSDWTDVPVEDDK